MLFKKKTATRSLQVTVDRAHNCESAAAHMRSAWRRADALQPALPTTVGQPCLWSPDQVSRVKHRINVYGAPQPPAAAAAAVAITPRALAEPPAAAEAAAAPAPARAEPPISSPTAAAAATASAPADALTAAPPVLSAVATAPAKAHKEKRGAGSTSARRYFTFLYHPLLSLLLMARQYTDVFSNHCNHSHIIIPPGLGLPYAVLYHRVTYYTTIPTTWYFEYIPTELVLFLEGKICYPRGYFF